MLEEFIKNDESTKRLTGFEMVLQKVSPKKVSQTNINSGRANVENVFCTPLTGLNQMDILFSDFDFAQTINSPRSIDQFYMLSLNNCRSTSRC